MARPKYLVVESETFGDAVETICAQLGAEARPLVLAIGRALIHLKDEGLDGGLPIKRRTGIWGTIFIYEFHPQYEITFSVSDDRTETHPPTTIQLELRTLRRRKGVKP